MPAAQVKKRYSVTDKSIWRWLKDDSLGYPQPIRIKGRSFWRIADLRAREDACTKTIEPPAVDAAKRLEAKGNVAQ